MDSEQKISQLSECINTLFEQADKQQKEIDDIRGALNVLQKKINPSAHGKSESPSDVPNSSEKGDTLEVKKYAGKYLKLITVIILMLLVGISVILYFVISNSIASSDPQWSTGGDGSSGGANNATSLGDHKILTRKEWGGRAMGKNTRPLGHPVPLVIISHTVTDYCSTLKSCSSIVKSIQAYHVSNFGSPDAGYNFLIGGDGNIYVARGWDIVNFHRDNTIGVAFIGNYVFDVLSKGMIDALKMLLEDGVEKGKLSQDYKIVAHNQTYNTESPGNNVYKFIKTLPQFDPRNVY